MIKKKISTTQHVEGGSGEANTMKQVLNLMNSLEKVEVGPKRYLPTTVNPNTQTPTPDKMPHHPIILNTPPTISKPTQLASTSITQNTHKASFPIPSQVPTTSKPNYTNPTPSKSPLITYTPTSVLISMIEQQDIPLRQNITNPHSSRHVIPTNTTKTLLNPKIKSLSPMKSSELKHTVVHSRSKWKSRPYNHTRQGLPAIVVNEKMKDVLVDVD